MEVGIVGKGHHSKRIQKILKKKKINFFLYKKLKDPIKNNIELNKLKKFKIISLWTTLHVSVLCTCVFVANQNETQSIASY